MIGSLARLLFLSFLILSVGGVIFFATWDLPIPVSEVEKVINNDRFEK